MCDCEVLTTCPSSRALYSPKYKLLNDTLDTCKDQEIFTKLVFHRCLIFPLLFVNRPKYVITKKGRKVLKGQVECRSTQTTFKSKGLEKDLTHVNDPIGLVFHRCFSTQPFFCTRTFAVRERLLRFVQHSFFSHVLLPSWILQVHTVDRKM